MSTLACSGTGDIRLRTFFLVGLDDDAQDWAKIKAPSCWYLHGCTWDSSYLSSVRTRRAGQSIRGPEWIRR